MRCFYDCDDEEDEHAIVFYGIDGDGDDCVRKSYGFRLVIFKASCIMRELFSFEVRDESFIMISYV